MCLKSATLIILCCGTLNQIMTLILNLKSFIFKNYIGLGILMMFVFLPLYILFIHVCLADVKLFLAMHLLVIFINFLLFIHLLILSISLNHIGNISMSQTILLFNFYNLPIIKLLIFSNHILLILLINLLLIFILHLLVLFFH